MLADALVGHGLLRKRSDEYWLMPVAESFLLKASPQYLGGSILHVKDLWEAWGNLTESVRTGRPHGRRRSEDYFPRFVRQLFPGNYRTATLIVEEFSKRGMRCQRILDVGAGAAAWSIPFAEKDRAVRVTALDFPPVLEVTQDYARRHRVESQFEFMPGNLRQLDFGREKYDLIILGNICHSEGEKNTQKLLRKSYRALQPDGHLLIADIIPHDDRTGPAIPLLFALNMLVNTEEGDVFTLAQYKAWLKAAGFRKISPVHVSSTPWPLILAVK